MHGHSVGAGIDRSQHRRQIQRLDQMLIEARRKASRDGFAAVITGDRDETTPFRFQLGAQLAHERVPVRVRQTYVEQGDVWLKFGGHAPGGRTRCGEPNLMTCMLEHEAEQLGGVGAVVDHEHTLCGRSPNARRGRRLHFASMEALRRAVNTDAWISCFEMLLHRKTATQKARTWHPDCLTGPMSKLAARHSPCSLQERAL